MNLILITPYSILIPLDNTVAITIADSLVDDKYIRIIEEGYKSYKPEKDRDLIKLLQNISEQYKSFTGEFIKIF